MRTPRQKRGPCACPGPFRILPTPRFELRLGRGRRGWFCRRLRCWLCRRRRRSALDWVGLVVQLDDFLGDVDIGRGKQNRRILRRRIKHRHKPVLPRITVQHIHHFPPDAVHHIRLRCVDVFLQSRCSCGPVAASGVVLAASTALFLRRSACSRPRSSGCGRSLICLFIASSSFCRGANCDCNSAEACFPSAVVTMACRTLITAIFPAAGGTRCGSAPERPWSRAGKPCREQPHESYFSNSQYSPY